MIVNRHRGEVRARLDGKEWCLCLTLGALAELEQTFDADDIVDLTERFSSGRMAAADMLKIIGAGLRGGGHPLPDEEVAQMQADGGIEGFAAIVVDLLTATFGHTNQGSPAQSE